MTGAFLLHLWSETLLMTALLLAVVLLLRCPVRQIFGPRIAYMLWLLPALRVFVPALPAWESNTAQSTTRLPEIIEALPTDMPTAAAMQTTAAAMQTTAATQIEAVTLVSGDLPAVLAGSPAEGALTGRSPAETAPILDLQNFDLLQWAIGDPVQWMLALWALGVFGVLAYVLIAYHRCRCRLLTQAVEIKRINGIRLLLGGAVPGPIALGFRKSSHCSAERLLRTL